MATYHIGVDSTDSAELGMCTTYLGARLLEEFSDYELMAPPELVRLNPNIPWKTRGNGAIAIRMSGEENRAETILERAARITEELSVLEDPQTNPGLAVVQGSIHPEINQLYRDALHDIIKIERAEEIAEEHGIPHRTWKSGRGLIGALSAIGFRSEERTYETILYRSPDIKVKDRGVDLESIRNAAGKYPSTFFNLDEDGRPVCIPHSPCPVILGIRGTDPEDTREAALSIEVKERERWVLWSTNQHTDAHIMELKSLKGLRDYASVSIPLWVNSPPEYTPGGHLQFGCRDSAGRITNCAAYEPTKSFRKYLSKLIKGDGIRVWGGVRPPEANHPRTINLEKVEIQKPVMRKREVNPTCEECGSRLESMGRYQGMRCKGCRKRYPEAEKIIETISRDLKKGVLQPPKTAWRHLFKPVGLKFKEAGKVSGKYWGF